MARKLLAVYYQWIFVDSISSYKSLKKKLDGEGVKSKVGRKVVVKWLGVERVGNFDFTNKRRFIWK